jgi:hypothetical protein
MWENPLFCKKAGFSHALSGKKLVDGWRLITESYKSRGMMIVLGRAGFAGFLLSVGPASCRSIAVATRGGFLKVPKGLPNTSHGRNPW